jgi:hypothetical protein
LAGSTGEVIRPFHSGRIIPDWACSIPLFRLPPGTDGHCIKSPTWRDPNTITWRAKLVKREIAWEREGRIAAAINYAVENLPPGHNAFTIKVQNDWRLLYSEKGVTSEWENCYVSADAAREALERRISRH